MAGLVPAIHVFKLRIVCKTWMPATSAGMTGQLESRQYKLRMARL
jgi:hypothetical protein